MGLATSLSFLDPATMATVTSSLAPWDGETPFQCGGNDSVEVRGQTVVLEGRTALSAEGTVTSESSSVMSPLTSGSRPAEIARSRLRTASFARWVRW